MINKGLRVLVALTTGLIVNGSLDRSALAETPAVPDWVFAVSGDSRNCGDVVMPAIATSVLQQKDVAFYWHLGDFRLMSGIDDDMQRRYGKTLTSADYGRDAWGDFIANQVAPFGSLPVFLGIGNHELAGGKTQADFLSQFAYWLDTPELRAQRLEDSSQDVTPRTFYHWQTRHVDFIYLDNAGKDGFEEAQLKWLEGLLARDQQNADIQSIVVGMHRALPNSYACGHSMNGDGDHPSVAGTASGRRAYLDLVSWKHDSKKLVYVLASHSHFYMEGIFGTDYWKNPDHGGVALPGWIVGTAGAQRYALPREVPPEVLAHLKAQTKVAGYLLGTVHSDGSIDFTLKTLNASDVPNAIVKSFGEEFVGACFSDNYDGGPHAPPASCSDQ